MTDGTAAKTPSSTHNLPQPSPLNLSALRSTSPAPPFVPTFDANSGARRAFVEIEQVYEPFRKQQNEAADFVFSEEKSARLEPAEPLPTSPPPPPYHDAERKAESSGTPGTMKNDIFASAFREGSIFHGLLSPQVDTPKQRQRDAPTPQSNRPNSASTPADTPRSKNSIFEMSHTISKPAVNMDANELSALRQGRLINSDELTYAGTSPRSPHQYYPPPHAQPPSTGKTYYGQGSPYSSSMTVPLSLPTPPAVTPSIASPPAIDNEAVFLTDANTSGRRGFVDLDESQFKVTPIVTVRKRPVDPDTEALTSPALLSPSSEATPAPSAKLRAAAEEARRRKARDRPQVIVSPAKWDNINLTFLPTRRNFLGEGRYAQVYLGYYTVTDSSPEKTPFPASSPRPPQSGLPDLESSDPLVPSSGNFHPCAVKRLHNTLESQSVGLSEVCILRKLSPLHPNIVKLIGVKDEADVDNPNVKAQLASSAENPTLESRPQTKKRTLSDSKTIDPSPRLLILLEYLPKGDMWEWVQRNKQSVGKRLWVKWARQLASAIACMHAEGIVHHDIKPHNVLVCLGKSAN
ncbi:uncharacterized protein EV422DRAFT_514848 [Fimicolochytrium jonesii]|uniref:uncharacterized protein n=1 Tax=Fimicolochytrium jonesii TaxID=1396493 RepID=UPI0022FE9CC9|nr:uncharacterized protein EV422DRAFT_514848 [Fimicolochytrium jonesii]KAI8825967.1 hypothetical protein EV422DRAFT_514848 [Fimicolochytrium jonesii]